jgi:hypothetical protein
MSLEFLRLTRDLLLRAFVIGLAIALILALFTFTGWTLWMQWATLWFHTSEAVLTPMVLSFFIHLRFFLLFCILMPGLAFHWTYKAELKKSGLSN